MARSSLCPLQLLPCALLLLNLLCASIAGLSIRDIEGRYTLERGYKNRDLCGDTAEIGKTNRYLLAQNINFDGMPCSIGRFHLFVRHGHKNYSNHINEKLGYRVEGHTEELKCQEYRQLDIWVSFSQPLEDVRVKIWGFTFSRTKGVKYFLMGNNSTSGCLYREALKESPTAGPAESNSPSGVPDGVGPRIWVWLGPVIGAGATIVGAIITAINWSRRRAQEDVHKLGIYDYEQDY